MARVLTPADAAAAEPVFVLAAPRSGGRRLARWLTGPQGRLNPWLERIAAARAARGLAWRDRSDQWSALEATQCSPWLQPVLTQYAAVAPRVSFEYASASLLRVAALAHWFPQARFVLVYRDVRETLSLMLDGWLAARQPHASGIQLPDGMHWNFALPPGWSAQCSRPLPEIVAWQWAKLMRIGLDMLTALAGTRWCLAAYDQLLADPFGEARRILGFLALSPDRHPVPTQRFLPAGRRSPDASLWQRHADALQTVAPIVAAQADRVVRLFARSPQTRVSGGAGRPVQPDTGAPES